RSGFAPRHRGARSASHPRRGVARDHVRPAEPLRHRSMRCRRQGCARERQPDTRAARRDAATDPSAPRRVVTPRLGSARRGYGRGMNKLVIGILLGGALGALVAKFQGGSGEQDSSPMVPAVASGAAVGAFFGLLLARRSRKAAKAAKAAAVPVALAYAKKMG